MTSMSREKLIPYVTNQTQVNISTNTALVFQPSAIFHVSIKNRNKQKQHLNPDRQEKSIDCRYPWMTVSRIHLAVIDWHGASKGCLRLWQMMGQYILWTTAGPNGQHLWWPDRMISEKDNEKGDINNDRVVRTAVALCRLDIISCQLELHFFLVLVFLYPSCLMSFLFPFLYITHFWLVFLFYFACIESFNFLFRSFPWLWSTHSCMHDVFRYSWVLRLALAVRRHWTTFVVSLA